jgi:hypothetical protein
MTETTRVVAIRKPLSAGARIAKQGCEQLVQFVIKHKSNAETIGQKPKSKEALL